jgi:hypothetical protein
MAGTAQVEAAKLVAVQTVGSTLQNHRTGTIAFHDFANNFLEDLNPQNLELVFPK